MSVDMSVVWGSPSLRLSVLGNLPFEYMFERVHYGVLIMMMPLLTVEAVAENLAVSRSTVVRLIANNEIAVTRIRRTVRISETALADYRESRTQLAKDYRGGR
jgi:excisionase family DNA binding protein